MSGVIHIITSMERGGAQRHTLETAARLHDPARPQLLITGAPGPLDDEARLRLGSRFLQVPALQNPIGFHDVAALLDLSRLLAREVQRLRPPVVVHTNSSKAGVLGRMAAKTVSGVVVVHTVHGFGLEALGPRRSWLLEAAEKSVATLAARTVFVSEADRQRAIELGLASDRSALLIRSGVDVAHYAELPEKSAARRALNVDVKGPVILTLANCKPQKDPIFHIEIFRAVVDRDPSARCLFVGDGPLRPQVEDRIDALGLRDHVQLHGFVDDVRPFLAAADVFLLASAWEGLPRTVLEATAAGLPCVVRDTGWAADVAFARSITALPALPRDSADADAFAIALLKKHRVVPKKLPREFTQDGMLEALRDLYDELCGPVIDDEERIRMLRRRRRLRR
ncbi:MAG: glycosyltransferase [Deltaproteobacteria bacterium]|nr:glycosyltransferase [Deltaproteobacteria bacterium]